MSEPTTAAMMAELREAVQRIQNQEFNRWFDENIQHWRDITLFTIQSVSASFMSMEEAGDAIARFGEALAELKDIHPDTPSANP